ncbi:tRNA (cytidine(34)-2'-O)-methyltransferase [Zwartia sp.]|uniref:tRNA (cytidine(34)-2'-O)-methyltransferase n=1 Tax=Zwartia sp. TaxID=2978004 RepID=UPI00271C1EB5|nr:tRNA (cytidine(34)-2'-O)-methyltransferase [Zwartia sp.]MDO9025869.1 tRNA (cytidine(34)-2'-O)-methyltransferase [Zwartia sp.]
MFDVILVQPEIPPNTGNVIRLCANTGARLHLVRPLGFEIDDTKLKRAGLDYHEWQPVQIHDSLQQALGAIGAPADRTFAMTTKATQLVSEVELRADDVFVFGRETAGLSAEQIGLFGASQRVRLPMLPGQRSLNLSNAVAVVVFEAWRQQGYSGAV